MRVLWLIDHVCYDGCLHGGGRLFMNLIPSMESHGVEIFPYFLRSSAEVEEVFENVEHRPTNLNRSKYDPLALMDIVRICKEKDIDVLHLFCYASSTFGRIAARMVGKPAIIHDFDTQIYFPYPMYLRVLDRVLAGATARGLAASQMSLRYMVDVRKVAEEKTDLLFHVIPEETAKAARARNREAARDKLGWRDNEVVFCCATKLGPERGNEMLLEAFAKVAADNEHARLAIVYKPTYYHRVPDEYKDIEWIRDTEFMRNSLVEKATGLGIESSVSFVESLDDPTLYMEAADAYVVPFANERFSSVNLVEALAFALPVVATDIGEQKAILENSDCGILVPNEDAAAFAAAMSKIAASPDTRREMGNKAEAHAREFSLDASALRMRDTYQQLIEGDV